MDDAPSADIFTPTAIASDSSWVPETAAFGGCPISPEDFVTAYLGDPGSWHWSTLCLDVPREIVLRRTLAIIAKARLPDHERALGQLGAGPLEDMMSNALLDDLGSWMPFSAAMCYALGSVRTGVEPPGLQRRLKAMVEASVATSQHKAI